MPSDLQLNHVLHFPFLLHTPCTPWNIALWSCALSHTSQSNGDKEERKYIRKKKRKVPYSLSICLLKEKKQFNNLFSLLLPRLLDRRWHCSLQNNCFFSIEEYEEAGMIVRYLKHFTAQELIRNFNHEFSSEGHLSVTGHLLKTICLPLLRSCGNYDLGRRFLLIQFYIVLFFYGSSIYSIYKARRIFLTC